MSLFDFSLMPGGDPRSEREGSAEDVIAYLDAVDGAGLVCSACGAFYDFAEGNRETADLAALDRRLAPAATADPRRLDAWEVDFHAAASEGFRALALFPVHQNWDLSNHAARHIARSAAEAALPIVLHVSRGTPVGAVAGFARSLDVPVVACGVSYGSVGEVAACSGEVDNLLFSMRLLCGLENLEALVARIGPERLVFESGEPLTSHAAALAVLQSARIDERARELIAAGNARRILGERP